MDEYKITDSEQLIESLKNIKKQLSADKLFILVDEHTKERCLSHLNIADIDSCHIIEIHSGDLNKTLHSLSLIWDALIEEGATRHSLIVNVGGGMITDIGGFAASTYKRGLPFVNVPTTLLAAVDASIGGKTGINYQGLKNEIGTFAKPVSVLINTDFFSTLDSANILSGYAEMVKHALISNEALLKQMMTYDLDVFDQDRLKKLIEQNLEVKHSYIESDPYDKGCRKALNFGHTIGHAIESFSHLKGEPVLHGYAVMWGMVGELYLSCKLLGLNKSVLSMITSFSKEYYGICPISCKEYAELYRIISHDKKNDVSGINFTLLEEVGVVRINQTVGKEDIYEALDFIREG